MIETSKTSPDRSTAWWLAMWAAVPVQAILLIAAGTANRFRMNPDGVVYMRLAEYLVSGDWSLFVTGYWGTLLSALIAAINLAVDDTIVAARVAVGLSALGLLLATNFLVARLGLSARSCCLGAWIVALATVYWSVVFITPDLLLGACIVAAVALFIAAEWATSVRTNVLCGVLLSAAYYAKPIGFPLSLICLGAFAVLHAYSGGGWRRIVRPFSITAATFLALSAPWVVTLSLKYDRPTFSTSGPIAYASIGPQRIPGLHPFVFRVHRPEEGRILSWEDPDASWYHPWSPLANAANAQHQWRVIRENFFSTDFILGRFAPLRLAWGILALALLAGGLSRTAIRAMRWRWVVVPVFALIVLYLPVYAGDDRYFYPAFPLLVAAAFGAAEWAGRLARNEAPWFERVLPWILTAILLLPSITLLPQALKRATNEGSVYAHYLAVALRERGIGGPVAGGGINSAQTGMYLAYLLREPWLGDQSRPDPGAFARSGAEVVLVRRERTAEWGFDSDERLENLDPLLFAGESDAETFPLKAYRVRREGP